MLLPFSTFWPTCIRLDAGAVHRQSRSAYEFRESCTLLAEIMYVHIFKYFSSSVYSLMVIIQPNALCRLYIHTHTYTDKLFFMILYQTLFD
jgi:hypothetical protein